MIEDEDASKKLEKTKRPPFKPPIVIPDTLNVPPDTIYIVPDHLDFINPTCYEKAGQKRAWFSSYFYNCLPIVFGNQHGFLVRATNSYVVRWDGSDRTDGVSIHKLGKSKFDDLIVESHFGHGLVTFQTRHHFRTPKGVNMMVKAPPNYPVHGLSWMDAVVETDNLRRDFTFNVRITRPQLDIHIPAGTPIGCVVPYPRFFLDKFAMKVLDDPDELTKAIEVARFYGIEREKFDDDKPRLRYMEGKDIFDNFYEQHQKTLDNGAWWKSSHPRRPRSTEPSGPSSPQQVEPAQPKRCPLTGAQDDPT